MSERVPMNCPRCGGVMNYHASKVVEPRTADEMHRADPVLGGLVTEVHSCPACGAGVARSQT